jgi:peptide deformylase
MKILTYPNEILRTKSTEVEQKGVLLTIIIKKLNKALMDTKNGIGLSAPQIGYNKRVFIMNLGKNKIFVNPVILEKSKETQTYPEGCLSFPGLFLDLNSPKWIRLEYLDESMTKHTEVLEGLAAVCASHEIDHLDGILMIDRQSKISIL